MSCATIAAGGGMTTARVVQMRSSCPRENTGPSSAGMSLNGRAGNRVKAKAAPESVSGVEVRKPGQHDVLLGRGGGTNNHNGNINFRKLVNEHKMRYLSCSKIEKPSVAREVVELWKQATPPGRFLTRKETAEETKNGGSDVVIWVEVAEKKAREKASQCLRERTPDVVPYIKQLRLQQDQMTEEGVSMVQQQLHMQREAEAQKCNSPFAAPRRNSLAENNPYHSKNSPRNLTSASSPRDSDFAARRGSMPGSTTQTSNSPGGMGQAAADSPMMRNSPMVQMQQQRRMSFNRRASAPHLATGNSAMMQMPTVPNSASMMGPQFMQQQHQQGYGGGGHMNGNMNGNMMDGSMNGMGGGHMNGMGGDGMKYGMGNGMEPGFVGSGVDGMMDPSYQSSMSAMQLQQHHHQLQMQHQQLLQQQQMQQQMQKQMQMQQQHIGMGGMGMCGNSMQQMQQQQQEQMMQQERMMHQQQQMQERNMNMRGDRNGYQPWSMQRGEEMPMNAASSDPAADEHEHHHRGGGPHADPIGYSDTSNNEAPPVAKKNPRGRNGKRPDAPETGAADDPLMVLPMKVTSNGISLEQEQQHHQEPPAAMGGSNFNSEPAKKGKAPTKRKSKTKKDPVAQTGPRQIPMAPRTMGHNQNGPSPITPPQDSDVEGPLIKNDDDARVEVPEDEDEVVDIHGEVTLDEYRKTLESYMRSNNVDNMQNMQNNPTIEYNSSDDEDIGSFGFSENDAADRPAVKRVGRAAPASRNVDRNKSGHSMMSCQSFKSNASDLSGLSLLSNMSLDEGVSINASGKSQNGAPASRRYSSTMSINTINTDISDISHTLDGLDF